MIDQLDLSALRSLSAPEQELFRARLAACWPDVERPLQLLYGAGDDFDVHLRQFLHIAARAYAERPHALRQLDETRLAAPDWFQESRMLGYVCYVDRFAGTLRGIFDKIDYLAELGITYLHLMPLLTARAGANDGGYAVADYRGIEPALGSMADLRALADRLREYGISLCIDLVCNHTAADHEWARRARAGDARYQDYYWMFPDRTVPNQYERTVREIFPASAPGSFTHVPEIDRWVWTTFHDYQWDLNYQNPAVFGEMLDILLHLANQGVAVMRLDAVAFMWKRMGTDCENQPEAHALLQAFRALSRIAAPGLLLKAEAIVPPPMLLPYLGCGEATNKECQLAYHNVLMVMLWSSLAERKVALMTHALQQIADIPSQTAWVTYVRCHDDIGWAVTEEDAAAVGLNGYLHRGFLSDFYAGRYAGSFARGDVFQYNPRTGDQRISGACASLAGLEAALERDDPRASDLAVRRILLVHSMIFAFGGIPLLYMGDEIGLCNDRSYLDDAHLAGDNRWMHRPFMDWDRAASRRDESTVAGRIFQGLRRLVTARQSTFALHAEAARYPVWTRNEHIFGLVRASARGRVLILGNFCEYPQVVAGTRLRELGFAGQRRDHAHDRTIEIGSDLPLGPYEYLWLA